MVNLAMVNAKPPCANRADFCIIFAVSGRFLHFKKPVKYRSRLQINHKTVHPAAPAASHHEKYTCIINALCAIKCFERCMSYHMRLNGKRTIHIELAPNAVKLR